MSLNRDVCRQCFIEHVGKDHGPKVFDIAWNEEKKTLACLRTPNPIRLDIKEPPKECTQRDKHTPENLRTPNPIKLDGKVPAKELQREKHKEKPEKPLSSLTVARPLLKKSKPEKSKPEESKSEESKSEKPDDSLADAINEVAISSKRKTIIEFSQVEAADCILRSKLETLLAYAKGYLSGRSYSRPMLVSLVSSLRFDLAEIRHCFQGQRIIIVYDIDFSIAADTRTIINQIEADLYEAIRMFVELELAAKADTVKISTTSE